MSAGQDQVPAEEDHWNPDDKCAPAMGLGSARRSALFFIVGKSSQQRARPRCSSHSSSASAALVCKCSLHTVKKFFVNLRSFVKKILGELRKFTAPVLYAYLLICLSTVNGCNVKVI